MKILVFGNILMKIDAMPIKLLPNLKKTFPDIEFKEFDCVEDLEKEGSELTIMDTVNGIQTVQIFENIEEFSESPTCSMHDFDLPVYIKLLKKLGILTKVTVIGIPEKGQMNIIAGETEKAIKKLMKS